jgi:hypothetical protein
MKCILTWHCFFNQPKLAMAKRSIFFQLRQSRRLDVCTSAGILWVDVPVVHFSISSLIMNVPRINNLHRKVILRILEGYFLTTAKTSTSLGTLVLTTGIDVPPRLQVSSTVICHHYCLIRLLYMHLPLSSPAMNELSAQSMPYLLIFEGW